MVVSLVCAVGGERARPLMLIVRYEPLIFARLSTRIATRNRELFVERSMAIDF